MSEPKNYYILEAREQNFKHDDFYLTNRLT